MDISVVIPLYNEDESIPELFSWIQRVMTEKGFTYEVIFINDGSTDNSWKIISELCEKYPEAKGIKFRRNYGKSPALYCGFKESTRRRGHHDGRRPAIFPRRDSGTLPYDQRGRLRPISGYGAEAL